MIAGTPHFAEPAERMRSAPDHGAAGQPDACGRADARAAHGDAGVDHHRRGTAGEPRSDARPWHAGGSLRRRAARHPGPALYRRSTPARAFTDPTVLPAKLLGTYPVFVPRADSDGMAIAGIRMLPLAVPRATYTGWNPRAEGFGAGTLFPLQGAVVPFAATRAEREASGDPRPSVAERYADNAAYVAAVRAAAARMVAERLLLPQDAERAIELATQDRLSQLH